MNLRAILFLTALVLFPLAPLRAQQPEPEDQKLPKQLEPLAIAATGDYNAQRYDGAVTKYQAILKQKPKCFFALSNLGVTYLQQGRFDLAKATLTKALALRPTSAFCLTSLGIIAYQQNDYAGAVQQLEAAVAISPNEEVSHRYLACAYERLGRAEDARIEFQKADLLAPKASPASPQSSLK